MKSLTPIILFIALIGCKSLKTTSTSTPATNPEIAAIKKDSVEKDTVVYYITQKGDTLFSLEEEVEKSALRVRKDTLSLTMVGDIMMGTNFPSINYLPSEKGENLWKEVRSSLLDSDITFGNLEGTILTEGGTPKECKNPKNCYLFRTPEELSYHFKENGFDLLSLANNHANDFGLEGRLNTQKVLDSLEINYAGSIEAPYSIVRRKDIVLGFLAMAPNKGTVLFHDQENAVKTIQMLDSLTDIVIVSLHIGAEGTKNQNVTRKTEFYFGEDRGNVYSLSRTLIDAGADVIIGHGPHVVRAVDVYKNRFIAYSLGNFLTYGRFNLRGPAGYAPIVSIKLADDGKFLEGNIESFIQDYNFGPQKDEKQRALEKIRYLTEIDFPESELKIDESGKILYLNR